MEILEAYDARSARVARTNLFCAWLAVVTVPGHRADLGPHDVPNHRAAGLGADVDDVLPSSMSHSDEGTRPGSNGRSE